MAFEKVLNTRIINKNADLSDWSTSTLKLKQGEIALAKFDAKTVNPLDGSITSTPAYAIKVGQEDKTFAEAAWLYAPASDVHAWAKKSALDYADLPAVLTKEIDDLQAAIGDNGSVATAIKNAIEALDVAESKDTDTENGGIIISAISEVDGKISVTRRALTDADIADLNVAMAKVTGLADALALKADKTQVATDIADAIAPLATTEALNGVDAKFAKYTTTEAQEAIDAAQDAEIDKKVDKVDGKDLIATSEIERLATLKNYDDTALAGRVTTAEGKITALETESAKHALKTEVEAVDAKFANYKTAEAQKAIDDEQDRRLGVLEAKPFDTYATKTEVQDVADDLAAYVTSNDKALADVKATAEAARTEEEVDSQIDTKITALNLGTTYEPIGAENRAKAYVDQKFTDADLAQYTTEQEVKDIVDGVIAGAVDGDTITGLANLVEYLNTHGTEAKEMGAAIDVLEGKVETIEGKPAYGITATQVSNWDGEVGAKALAQGVKDVVDANKETWDKAGTALQAADLKDYAKTADVVTNDEFTAFEATNTAAIQAAQKAGVDAAAAVAEDLAEYIDGKSMSDADLKKYADDAISTFNTTTVDPIAARVKAIEDAPYATTANVATAKAEAIAAAKEDLEKRDFAGITSDDIAAWNTEKGAMALAGTKTTMAEVEAKGYAVASDVTTEFAKYTKTADLDTTLGLTTKLADKADKSVVDAMYTNEQIDGFVAGAKSGAEATAAAALAEYKTSNDAALAAVKGTADTAVQTVVGAENSGLTASKTGTTVTIDFASDCVFVFDCGNHQA